ncbi:MAG: hypothetical protein ACFFDG_14580, partial [Promethearchaeota archaeon]
MKADNNNSQEKIRKATELLQKSWWFSWFLIIAPLTTAIVGFFIFRLFRIEFYLALSFAVVVFMFALLLFYKAFDKYRNNPFFLDKTNNLKARIHIIFLISTLAFIATPIFILISPVGYSFITLPLISYALLYNIVYYYCYFQPLDFYDLNKGEFKHAQDFKLILKQPYNFLLFLNYIIHIIFLSITASTNFSWLYSLITNLFIYFITITSTKKQINEIDVLILEKKSFLKELTLYKLKLTISLINLIFILLIQLPFIVLITSILSGTHYSNIELVNSFFLSLIFILFYFKSRFYISFYYTSRLTVYEEAEKLKDVQERPPFLSNKYQKYNSYFSGLLILLIMLFSFLINIPVLILFILPFLYILFHYEQKSDLCSKKYNKYIILLNSFVILISICFGLLPQISEIFYINIQFISFLFLSYFALQLFAKFGYFNKDNIIIYQNIIGVSCFSLILYSFFPIVIFEYISFTSDPFIIFISNFLVHSLLILIIFLVSFYVLYIRFFYAKRPKLFKISVVVNIFLIELILFTLINLRIFYLVELFTFFQILILSTILFP